MNSAPWPAFLAAALRRVSCLVLTVVLAALLGAALMRLAPGFGMDERQLDARFSDSSLQTLRRESGAGLRLSSYFAGYLAGLCRGDLGQSVSFGQPVRDLIGSRLGLTARSVALGMGGAWSLAAVSTLALGILRRRSLDRAASIAGGALLCLPAAIVALLAFYYGAGPSLAIGAILLPRIFRYMRGVTSTAEASPHVLAARSRGAGGLGLQIRHIWLPAAPELLALGGVSVNMALGAAIPVEALCDSPGIGQLVWKVALARDLPVMVNLTILVAAVTAAANLMADIPRVFLRRGL